MSSTQLKTLLFSFTKENNAATITDHLAALETFSGHSVDQQHVCGDLPPDVDLNDYQVVIIHYSLILAKPEYGYISESARSKIQSFTGLKVAFIQDEYRWVNETIHWIRSLGIDLLFSCIPPNELQNVYPQSLLPDTNILTTLTGFVPPQLLDHTRPKYGDRPIDVGYRGRDLPAAYGRLAQEKKLIATGFASHAAPFELSTDIAFGETERLYGKHWISFISNCKSMLGTESGASVFDFEDTIIPSVFAAESKNPDISFEELEALYFPGADGKIILNQISPRCFECASLGTLMILFEGNYSGILHPWEHYVPLQKDFSNINEVVDALRNEATWTRITAQAYDQVACNHEYSYRKFGEFVGEAISENHRRKQLQPATPTVAPDDQQYVATTIDVKQVSGHNLLKVVADLSQDYSLHERTQSDLYERIYELESSLLKASNQKLDRSYREYVAEYQTLLSSRWGQVEEEEGNKRLLPSLIELDRHEALKILESSYQELESNHEQLGASHETLNRSHQELLIAYQALFNSHENVVQERDSLKSSQKPVQMPSLETAPTTYKNDLLVVKLEAELRELLVAHKALLNAHENLNSRHEEVEASRQTLNDSHQELLVTYQALLTSQEKVVRDQDSLKPNQTPSETPSNEAKPTTRSELLIIKREAELRRDYALALDSLRLVYLEDRASLESLVADARNKTVSVDADATVSGYKDDLLTVQLGGETHADYAVALQRLRRAFRRDQSRLKGRLAQLESKELESTTPTTRGFAGRQLSRIVNLSQYPYYFREAINRAYRLLKRTLAEHSN